MATMMVGNGGAPSSSANRRSLSTIYPVNSLMELTLSDNSNTILRGLIYCTDDISNTIVLKKSLVHTTLSSEITLVNASNVVTHKIIFDYNTNNAKTSLGKGKMNSAGGKNDTINNDGTATNNNTGGDDAAATTATDATNDTDGANNNNTTIFTEEEARAMAGVQHLDELKLPLPNVSVKILEERERRALRLAEESLSHINQGASPTGQKIFDKLLKACNEVVWKGESIVVLKEIRVDPPYTAENCVLIRGGGGGGGGSGGGNGGSGSAAGAGGGSGGLDEHSLERVKKIVLAASSTAM